MSAPDRRRERWAFGALLLLQALLYVYLIAARRIPKGHDTLSVYLLQYIFQSHAAQGSGPLLWMPNLAHGVVSTWFAGLQSSPLQNALLFVGGAPVGTPMIPLFYAGLFLEDLLLTIGVWHLGGHLYRRLGARFFVTVAAVGSSVWVSNIYWNHRLVYAVPLMAALLLDFLRTGSRPRLFLAASLSALNLLGNALYIPVLSSFAVILFVAIHAWVHRKSLRPSASLLRPRRTDPLWLAAIAVVIASVCVALVQGLGSIRQFHQGRGADGTVSADAFLTFPGGLSPLRYLDLVFGLTPSSDYSLYGGLCTAALAVLAFVHRPGRAILPAASTFLLLLFFSMGYLSIVGMIAYEAAPPLHFFRYVSLAAPLARLFFILIAGFGVDAFARASAPSRSFRWAAIALGAVGLFGVRLLWVHLRGDADSDPLVALLDYSRLGLAPREWIGTRDGSALPGLILVSAAAAALFARRSRGGSPALLLLLLALHAGDVFLWRLLILREGTTVVAGSALALHRVEPIPYAPRRTLDYTSSARYRAAGDDLLKFGATYDYGDAFLHLDPSWSRFFVTQWSTSIDLLLRAHAGQSLTADGDAPPGLISESKLAMTPPSYSKAVGESVPKLQVFSLAHVARSDEEITALVNRRDDAGDALLLSPSPTAPPTAAPLDLARNDRLPVEPTVLDYRGDRIRVRVELPAPRTEGWLFYSDAWHPHWTATIDGVHAPVERACLAYKAVRLHAGANDVEFRFSPPWRPACARIVGLLSLFWFVVVAAWTLALLVGTRSLDAAPSERREGSA